MTIPFECLKQEWMKDEAFKSEYARLSYGRLMYLSRKANAISWAMDVESGVDLVTGKFPKGIQGKRHPISAKWQRLSRQFAMISRGLAWEDVGQWGDLIHCPHE